MRSRHDISSITGLSVLKTADSINESRDLKRQKLQSANYTLCFQKTVACQQS